MMMIIIIITQNSAFYQYTDLPCPPVANLVPSGWMSTENIGFPGIREQTANSELFYIQGNAVTPEPP